jgi:hypothetical protein
MNDLGLNFHTDIGKATLVTFLVNGSDNGFALGGRVAYAPFDAAEMGFSYLTQTQTNEQGSKPRVVGGDLQTQTGPLATRLEIHYSQDLLDGDFSAIDSISTHHGLYLQADLDLTDILKLPLVLIGRYDDWSTVNNIDEAQRTTVGLAYSMTEELEFRAEYLSDFANGDQDNHQLSIQTVVSF